jgi:ABC-type transporter Mla maintaining outer membrane lipid asymmetry ATPase subunit MlaF
MSTFHEMLFTYEELMAIRSALSAELVNMRQAQKTAEPGELSGKFARRMKVTEALLADFKNKTFR